MSSELRITDLFWTLQGEGRWTGRRALFVRMPFCNYDCPWCDTEYDSYDKYSEESFLEFARQEPARFAVITGGEPLANKDTPRIIELLKKEGFYIACETNGSQPPFEGIDFVTVSPKRYTKNKFAEFYIDENVDKKASEFKYVVDDGFDFNILKKHMPKEGVTYSLSPEFSKMKANTEKIIGYIRENPQWKLSLQTHKWIGIE